MAIPIKLLACESPIWIAIVAADDAAQLRDAVAIVVNAAAEAVFDRHQTVDVGIGVQGTRLHKASATSCSPWSGN